MALLVTEDLAQRILQLLARKPSLTAREIAPILEPDRAVLNRALYNLKSAGHIRQDNQ